IPSSRRGKCEDLPRIMIHGSAAVAGGFRMENSANMRADGGFCFSTYSHALPTIWRAPKGLVPSGKAETGRRPLLLTLARLGSLWFPQGNRRPSAPRAA